MKIKFKKLPRGWSYVASLRQIKKFVRGNEVDVRCLSFCGPGGRPHNITPGLYSAGALDARVDDKRWCYRFRFYGLPDEVLASADYDVSKLVINNLESFANRECQKNLDSTINPEVCWLHFRMTDGVLTPAFSKKKQDSLSEIIDLSNQWWRT